jgi:hypothetical protein
VSAGCSVTLRALPPPVEDHHARMVFGGGHLEADPSIDDGSVEGDDTVEFRQSPSRHG